MGTDIDPSVAEIEQAAFQLRRLWAKPQLLRRLREECEQGQGIQLSNLMVIYAIVRQGEDQGDVTVGAVAELLDVDPSTASRLVGHAIDAGFVSRHASPVDARRAHLQLTDAGRSIKLMADEFRRRFIAQLVADWSPDERAQFARLLRRFSDAAAGVTIDEAEAGRLLEAAAPPTDRHREASASPGTEPSPQATPR
ncbi:MarR family winged helix-turn-helix transcriptional regulator [Actinoallomurus purpureus]|uniref:MarR family winged helix-turn-helix transcriptional regulator n=1 Tax=Actinoallomurus purpureus TaxID=478114 RepID=UPI0020937CB4|nr:MarR family winged helix-turn-helix transcriptional regulator [Actinoallomurus purpureus]MCO6010884.1 MarR family winged helix-turn-helix transcriptional regulator [Actinoallomurus purpureus]